MARCGVPEGETNTALYARLTILLLLAWAVGLRCRLDVKVCKRRPQLLRNFPQFDRMLEWAVWTVYITPRSVSVLSFAGNLSHNVPRCMSNLYIGRVSLFS